MMTDGEIFAVWMNALMHNPMRPENMLRISTLNVPVILTESPAVIPREPHDPFRNRQPASTLLPGQVLVKLPGDTAWRHLGLMADPMDASEVAWRFRQQDSLHAFAWVDEDGRLMELSHGSTERG